MLWIGIAAAVMGVVTLLLPGLPFILQTVVFALLAVMIALLLFGVPLAVLTRSFLAAAFADLDDVAAERLTEAAIAALGTVQ